jgi:hypothetical protein
MDLADSDSDAPFTLKTGKGKEIKKHEILIKHERTTDSPANTPSPSPTPSNANDLVSPFEVELKILNRKIEALDEILKMYEEDDAEYKKYKDKKRELLVYKFEILDSYSTEPSMFTPVKK